MDANTQHMDVAMINIQQLEVNFSLFGIKCQVFFQLPFIKYSSWKKNNIYPQKRLPGALKADLF